MREVVEGLCGRRYPFPALLPRKILPSQYYKWLMQFLEVGKNALTSKFFRNAIIDEVVGTPHEEQASEDNVGGGTHDVIKYKKVSACGKSSEVHKNDGGRKA